jgi:hypothetical protein
MKHLSCAFMVVAFLLVLSVNAVAAAPVGSPVIWDAATMTADSHHWYHDNYHPRRTVNGDGMDVTGLLATFASPNRWLDRYYGQENEETNLHPGTVAGPSWIGYDLGTAMTLSDMWVWNAASSTPTTNIGLRNVTIEYSLTGGPDANEWQVVWTGDFNEATGLDNAPHETEVSFGLGGIEARYVVITPSSVNGTWGASSYVGLAEVMFFATSEFPQDPSPVDEAQGVDKNTVLTWAPGVNAASHNVYLGTVFDDVNDREASTFKGNQATTTYPETGTLDLESGYTYYWCVDEINGVDKWEGPVWSFTVMGSVIMPWSITATESSHLLTYTSGERTIDLSGLDNMCHTNNYNDMWLTASGGGGSSSNHPIALSCAAWIKYEFDAVYELGNMYVWNYNQGGSYVNRGLRNVRVDYSADGSTYTQAGTYEWPIGTSHDDMPPTTHLNFGGAAVKSIIITALSTDGNWGDTGPKYGLSEVMFFLPVATASAPSPSDKAYDVDRNVVLSWETGTEALSHDVYFGDDFNDVQNRDTSVFKGNQSETTYPATGSLTLELDKIYYWCVDEINGGEKWEGDVWSFTITDHLIVDDMESHNTTNNLPFNIWLDSWSYNNTGAMVGFDGYSTFIEMSIVHGGSQSLYFTYDNTSSPYYSEAEAHTHDIDGVDEIPLAIGKDWSDASAIDVWYRGTASNSSEKLYIGLKDTVNPAAYVIKEANDANIASEEWQVFRVALSDFTGVDMNDVSRIFIGVGDVTSPAEGGSGILRFDDIGLWMPRCLPEFFPTAGDINGDCIVDMTDIRVLTADWLGPDPLTVLQWDDNAMTADAKYWPHENYNPVVTVNGAGIDSTGLLAQFVTGAVWADTQYGNGTNPHPGTVTGATWIGYDFGAAYNLADMWVWNGASGGDGVIGVRNVTIEYSLTGGSNPTEWTTAWVGEFNKCLGADNYPHETEVNFGTGGINARYVVITPNTVDGTWGTTTSVRLSEVRFFGDFTQVSAADLKADGIVNFEDFAVMSEFWQVERLWPLE